MSIWTDAILDQFAADGAVDIVNRVPCIYHRFYLLASEGEAIYQAPSFVTGIKRITWRGKKLQPVNWEDMLTLSPMKAPFDESSDPNDFQGTPQWYALNPSNIRHFRLFPAPNESLIDDVNEGVLGEDPYFPGEGEARCTISCWRSIDDSNPILALPSYIDRRTRKAYVLWKAFEKEGKGQDSRAAAFYQAKYEFLVQRFVQINDGCFLSKRYSLDDTPLTDNHRYPRPSLPSNFERVIY